ncbi:MAG: ABC transporter substrate-binding protein [Deltaproteobacteria bacterium]|nr:ABC transporter substrate-binding protein [Deltaproteobacteria bacterium]
MKRNLKIILMMMLCLFCTSFVQAQAKKDTTIARPQNSAGDGKSMAGGLVTRESGQEAALGTPTRAIQDLETKMDSYKTGDNLTAEEKAKNVQIKKEVITGTFDIRELSKLSLDKHWASLSAAEQNNFVNIMTQLLEKKAILSKEQGKTRGKKFTIRYLGDTFLDAQKTKSKTKTSIYVPKENLNLALDYKLMKAGKDWKIFDVIVDEASLVENYKYQFNSIITKYGYPELITRMNKKLKDMDSNS